MLHGVEFEKQGVHSLVRLSGGDVGVPPRLACTRGRRPPRPPPGKEILLQGGDDLLGDLRRISVWWASWLSSNALPLYSLTAIADPRLFLPYQEGTGR